MILSDKKVVEHFSDVCHDCHLLLLEMDKNSQQAIIKVKARQQYIVEGDAIILHTGIEHHPDLVRVLRMVDTKCWQVPTLLVFLQRRSWLGEVNNFPMKAMNCCFMTGFLLRVQHSEVRRVSACLRLFGSHLHFNLKGSGATQLPFSSLYTSP